MTTGSDFVYTVVAKVNVGEPVKIETIKIPYTREYMYSEPQTVFNPQVLAKKILGYDKLKRFQNPDFGMNQREGIFSDRVGFYVGADQNSLPLNRHWYRGMFPYTLICGNMVAIVEHVNYPNSFGVVLSSSPYHVDRIEKLLRESIIDNIDGHPDCLEVAQEKSRYQPSHQICNVVEKPFLSDDFGQSILDFLTCNTLDCY